MICRLCPRECGAERTEGRAGGICGQPSLPVAARAMLHRWEEPCLVGVHGAGAVFFPAAIFAAASARTGLSPKAA